MGKNLSWFTTRLTAASLLSKRMEKLNDISVYCKPWQEKKKKKTKQESEKEMGSHLEDFSLQISK